MSSSPILIDSSSSLFSPSAPYPRKNYMPPFSPIVRPAAPAPSSSLVSASASSSLVSCAEQEEDIQSSSSFISRPVFAVPSPLPSPLDSLNGKALQFFAASSSSAAVQELGLSFTLSSFQVNLSSPGAPVLVGGLSTAASSPNSEPMFCLSPACVSSICPPVATSSSSTCSSSSTSSVSSPAIDLCHPCASFATVSNTLSQTSSSPFSSMPTSSSSVSSSFSTTPSNPSILSSAGSPLSSSSPPSTTSASSRGGSSALLAAPGTPTSTCASHLYALVPCGHKHFTQTSSPFPKQCPECGIEIRAKLRVS